MSRLEGMPRGGVAVIVSPVGYGATTLLAMTAEASVRPVVWVSGRGHAGSVESIWRQLAEGLGSVGVAAPDAPADLATDPSVVRREVAGLVSAASDVPDFLLVLDDLPRDEGVESMVQQLLDELPATVRVAITSTTVPRLDLSRLARAGSLVLLGRADLALQRQEAEAYLDLVAPDLPARSRSSLIELADGWFAALRASTSASGSDPSADPASWLLGPGLELLFGQRSRRWTPSTGTCWWCAASWTRCRPRSVTRCRVASRAPSGSWPSASGS